VTVSTSDVLERLELLVAQFNRNSLDLPDGFLDRNAAFRLNGVAYEDTLGRPADDPLVRLVARGPAAYRFLAKALRYAIPDAVLALRALERKTLGDGSLFFGAARLSGTLRRPAEAFDQQASIELRVDAAGRLVDVSVTLDPAAVDRLRAARLD
jgi:hypothetical protein